MNRLKKHLTVANVLSCMALFVALSGVAYAAGKIGTGAVKATNIAKEAVTNPKLKKQAVTSGKIKDGNVNAADLATGAVINSKLAKKAVTNAKLGNESVGASKLAKKSVTESKLAGESVSAAKLSASFYLQLIKNVSYVNTASVTNNEPNKTATAECPAGKQAIAGGVRLEGELKEVATTASYPFSTGTLRTGWTGIAHESGAGPYGDWSIVTFAVCAEL